MLAQINPCLTDPDQVQTWLMELPWLNVDQTTASLIDQLKALGQTQIPPPQRNRLLKLYRSPSIQLSEDLENRLLDCALPMGDPDQETARRLLELCHQMIANHTLVIFAPEFLDPEQLDPAECRITLTHMLDWLARLALHSAQIYSPPAEDFWRTVYRIYLLLETQAFLSQSPDLRTQLGRILLFGACGPGRFRPRELKQIDQFLYHFAGYAEIQRQSILGNRQARFFFDCATFKPPRSVKLLKAVAPPPRGLRFLYPHKVTQKLLECVAGIPNQELLPQPQAKKLALRLAHILGAPRQRKWRRLREQRECLLIAGLSELIAALIREGQIDKEFYKLVPASAISADTGTEFSADFELLPLEDGPIQQHDNQRSEVNIFRQLLDGQAKIDAHEIWLQSLSQTKENGRIRFSGRFADVCAQGYCLIWLDHACTKLKVGEILGINHTQGEIEVGTIRWLRQETTREIAVGVELLSFAASLVVVSLWLPFPSPAVPQREWGLLLPAQPVLGRPACLLAPAFAWQRGQWVEIYRSLAERQNYCLKQLIDSTPAYDLFGLEKIN